MCSRGLAAGALVLFAAMVSCATHTGEEDEPGAEPGDDVPLDLTVDRVDIAHGALRLSATMVDGSADVSVVRGGACERRQIGSGISTRSTLVWTLDESELAVVLDCDLLVRVHVRTEIGFVTKTASLSVAADINAPESEGSGEGPQLRGMSSSLARSVLMRRPLVIRGVSFQTSLTVGGTVLEVESRNVN